MKSVEVIIMKQTVSEGYYVYIRGHPKNPEFKSCLTKRLATYKDAYDTAHIVADTLIVTGNIVELKNDKYAAQDGFDYCEKMAFENLRVTE